MTGCQMTQKLARVDRRRHLEGQIKERGELRSIAVDYVCQNAGNGQTGIPLAIIFFLCRNPIKRALARLSNRSGTIVRVTMKFP